MIEANKSIEEDDQVLVVSLITANQNIKQDQNISIEINRVSKDVEKIISNMHRLGNTQKQQKNQDIQGNNKLSIKQQIKGKESQLYRKTVISRYNYTGQKYRFEERQEILNINLVQISQTGKTEVKIPKQSQERKVSKRQQAINKSVMGDNSLMIDKDDIKYPSHNYYIVFNGDKKGLNNMQQQQQKKQMPRDKINDGNAFNKMNVLSKGNFDPSFFSNTIKSVNINKSNNFTKTKERHIMQNKNDEEYNQKPKWILQRKINNLEKQVRRLNEKEAKRQYVGIRGRVDNRINLGQKVQGIINDLFP